MNRLNSPVLAPSILAADHASLKEGQQVVSDNGLEWIHLDIMDGHFVPNLSFGPETVAALRRANTSLFFDTHLMLDNPHLYIEAFANAGSDLISIHVEPEYDVLKTLNDIKARGIQCGIVLNPSTPPEAAEPYLKMVDLVLVMTVWPGFGGQSFIDDCLSKMGDLNRMRNDAELNFRLEVDGGINYETAKSCADRGVDTFVAGTAFFKDPKRLIERVQSFA